MLLLASGRSNSHCSCCDSVEVGKPEPAISRVLYSTTIHLGRPSPVASSNLPGSPLGTGGADKPPTPLFGLAPGGVCRAAACYQSRGALLPHLFTLTGMRRRSVFCGTFHGLAPSRSYLAPCPKEPGLSSATSSATAVVWPTPVFPDADSTPFSPRESARQSMYPGCAEPGGHEFCGFSAISSAPACACTARYACRS